MQAFRAKYIVTMMGEVPARGRELLTPLATLDNAALVTADGVLVDICQAREIPVGCEVRDLGDVTLIPGTINCHTHIQLSALAGQTCFSKGFTPWLASLVAGLRNIDPANMQTAIVAAGEELQAAGTAAVGDICGSVADGLAPVAHTLEKRQIVARHFCEWFGFAAPFLPTPEDGNPWPLRVREELSTEGLVAQCAPAGHALYSTKGSVLARAKAWCARQHRVFSLHLAESPEETELLLSGTGPLRDFYEGIVLPENWQAPSLRPLAYANRLGLLGKGTMAVHGTQLNASEMDILAENGTTLCLCPRSNSNLAVGQPNVRLLMTKNILLCLGTDGLSSNTDLDVRHEALFLREHHDVPFQALVRMLTVNGAAALGLPGFGQFRVGQKMRYAIWK